MKKAIWLLLAVSASAIAAAQEEGEAKVSAETKRYREYRLQATEPAFGLAKVKKIAKGIKRDQDDNRHLPAAAFNRLSTAEKFTYCMIHGEDASQNCDGMPWVVDEQKKIFSNPPGIFGDDAAWSEQQWNFLRNHRTEVIRLVRTTIRGQQRVGVNLKAIIARLDGNELIPDLVTIYNRDHKDQDILTVLMLLMRDGKYEPFVKSASYRKLYGPDANYQSFLDANPANQKLTTDRAMAFYRTRVH